MTAHALSWLTSALRLVAISLVVVGFIGSFSSDPAPVVTGSVYTFVFWTGVACAVVSIYLGIFLHGAETDR